MMIQEPSVGQLHAQDGPHNQPGYVLPFFFFCSSFSTCTLPPPRGPGRYRVKPLGSALQLVQGQCHPCPHLCSQRHQTPLCSVCRSSLVITFLSSAFPGHSSVLRKGYSIYTTPRDLPSEAPVPLACCPPRPPRD